MDSETLVTEMEHYSISDLELICRTQEELYSKEEMELIREILERKKSAAKQTPDEFGFAVTLFCIVAVLTPVSGLVVGIVMLIKGSPRWKNAGKKTLLAVLISVIIRIFLYSGGFSI